MSFSAGFAAGLFVGKKKWGNGGGEPSDDWQPPSWWIPVPEPEPYDIYILVWASKNDRWNNGMKFDLTLCREADNEVGHGNIYCDFGNGTVIELNNQTYLSYTYTEEGQYLVHIVADENANCWRSSGQNQAAWQIVKTGEKIAFVTDYNEQNGYYLYSNLFPNKSYLKYIQINHPRGAPINTIAGAFSYYTALRKLELNWDEITSVGNRTFEGCTGLEKMFLPSCTALGDYAFQGCYNLQEIIVAENCTFGTNCFQNCYSLYPRPDGSTN